MRALVTTAHGERGVLQLATDFEKPAPQIGEVLIRVAYTAVNYHDIFTRRGMPGIRVPLPIIVGSDIAGEIEAVGEGARRFKPGDRVMVDPYDPTNTRFGLIGETRHGGRAQYVCVPETQAVRVPDAVKLEAAASLPLAYATALRMLERASIRPGERVLVLGASGGVGVACVQLAKMMGAEVAACASTADKVERLRLLGADHLINYAERNFSGAVHDLFGKPRITGGGGVDVAVNFTGGDTWLDTQRSVCLGGRIVTCGSTAGAMLATDARFLWMFEHSILGSRGWQRSDLLRLLDMIAEGRLAPVIEDILPLEDGAEAERRLEEREVFGKLLLDPWT